MTSPTAPKSSPGPALTEPDSPTETTAPRRHRRRSVIAGGLVLAAAALMLPGTQATWSAAATKAVGTIASGYLGIVESGTGTWTETTPGLTPAPVTLTNRLITPGDSFEGVHTYTVTSDGDNLAARFSMNWTTPKTAVTGVDTAYTVSVGTTTTARTPVGTATAPIDLPKGNSTVTVRLYVSMPATAGQNETPTQSLAGLGAIRVQAEQVRTGGGFQ